MPFAQNAGARLYWRTDGREDLPPLLLLNSIGADMGSWDRAMPYLLGHARVLRMDARGHGASDAPEGEYTMDLLAGDALAVLDAAGVERAAVCGVSLGGMVAMTLALKAPKRVCALVAACTSPRMDAEVWRARIAAVQAGGITAIAEAALGRFFASTFTTAHPEVVDGMRAALVSMSGQGYAGCGAALRDTDLRPHLGHIGVPTLVIGAEKDVSTPFTAHGQLIGEGVRGAQVVLLDAGHLAQVEAPSAFTAAMVGFLRGLERPAEAEAAAQLYCKGLETRRQVLGDAWVDRSLARRTPFTTEFQAMITRVAWREVWSRPGLDLRTRRLLVLSVTAALGRWEEFRMHVRSGLDQGDLAQDELKETLMQLALYAGLPAANTAFAEANDILASLSAEPHG